MEIDQNVRKLNFQPFYLLIVFFTFIFQQHSIAQENTSQRHVDTNVRITQKKSPTHLEQKQSISAESRDYPIRISKKAGEEQIVHDEDYLRKELERIDLHIKAIDVKMASVNSDPAKRSTAEAEGWFDQMNSTKESLLIDRKEILEALKPYQSK